MANKVMVCLVVLTLLLPLPCTVGCDGTGLLQDANAVTLESSLISMQNSILKYLVYKSMNIPLTTTTTGL